MLLTHTEQTLWRLRMHDWTEQTDEGLVTYIRQRENDRTRRWYADAGLINLLEPLTRHEVDRCRETILVMPRFTDIRPGPTTWARKRRSPHTPPPLPARFARSR